MGIHDFYQSWSEPGQRRLLQHVVKMVPAMKARAERLDRDAQFPSIEFAQLRPLGLLSAVIPQRLGGLGLGIDGGSTLALLELLRLLGRANLAVGRIF
jgi:alkylation response protein AidB-like acyl-CoA dehydrogenase